MNLEKFTKKCYIFEEKSMSNSSEETKKKLTKPLKIQNNRAYIHSESEANQQALQNRQMLF